MRLHVINHGLERRIGEHLRIEGSACRDSSIGRAGFVIKVRFGLVSSRRGGDAEDAR